MLHFILFQSISKFSCLFSLRYPDTYSQLWQLLCCCYVSGIVSSYNNNCLLISLSFNSIVPISILVAHIFFDTLTNFLGLFGYWASTYAAVILVEHLYFRKNDPSLYVVTACNVPKGLPSGIAAGVLSFGIVIPCMSQIYGLRVSLLLLRGILGLKLLL